MIISGISLALFTIGATAPGFRQEAAIDTSRNFLETTPHFTEAEALEEYRKLEIDLVKTRKADIGKYFYLLFRYRDAYFSDMYERAAGNGENPVVQVWAMNALQQMENRENPRIFRSLSKSENPIFREMAANAFSWFGTASDTLFLRDWAGRETNDYVVETLRASIITLGRGGYKDKFEYLPVYYPSDIRKLKFFYNKSVASKSGFSKEFLHASRGSPIPPSPRLVYPHQQFLHSIKNAPRRSFGNKHGRKYHTGEDAGWFLEGLPIHSIGSGIVRKMTHETSWGVFVAIETRLPDDSTVMVYYGHLSENLDVEVGDIVHAGRKIGQIGNSVSYENGGYWPHLHIGIESVPFEKASCLGYDTDIAGWKDPTDLIRRFEK